MSKARSTASRPQVGLQNYSEFESTIKELFKDFPIGSLGHAVQTYLLMKNYNLLDNPQISKNYSATILDKKNQEIVMNGQSQYNTICKLYKTATPDEITKVMHQLSQIHFAAKWAPVAKMHFKRTNELKLDFEAQDLRTLDNQLTQTLLETPNSQFEPRKRLLTENQKMRERIANDFVDFPEFVNDPTFESLVTNTLANQKLKPTVNDEVWTSKGSSKKRGQVQFSEKVEIREVPDEEEEIKLGVEQQTETTSQSQKSTVSKSSSDLTKAPQIAQARMMQHAPILRGGDLQERIKKAELDKHKVNPHDQKNSTSKKSFFSVAAIAKALGGIKIGFKRQSNEEYISVKDPELEKAIAERQRSVKAGEQIVGSRESSILLDRWIESLKEIVKQSQVKLPPNEVPDKELSDKALYVRRLDNYIKNLENQGAVFFDLKQSKMEVLPNLISLYTASQSKAGNAIHTFLKNDLFQWELSDTQKKFLNLSEPTPHRSFRS